MAPLNNADFSSQLLQAQASKAKVIGLANAGADAANSIKQAAEFGVTQSGQKLAALLLFLSDVHAIGLNTAQGLQFTVTYYWDLNDQTRAFADRFSKRSKNAAKPSMVPAGVYSSVVHYLKAVEALGSHRRRRRRGRQDEGHADRRIRPWQGLYPRGRPQDPSRCICSRSRSRRNRNIRGIMPSIVATIPAEEAFRPLAQSECPLVKK